jgi:NTE family protein
VVSRETTLPVAIACQGGGRHAAFTAGVLRTLLEDPLLDVRALSGTSGGAVCAVAGWSALVGRQPHAAETARERLTALWEDNTTPWWALGLETAVLAGLRIGGNLGLSPEVSAYSNPFEAHDAFLRLVERHVPFGDLQPDTLTDDDPRLLISAAQVLTGEFRVFPSHRLKGYGPDAITARVILASSALQTVFRAVALDDGVYWDGGFTQNPPLRELIPAARRDVPVRAPLEDVEVWIVQLNPETRATVPTSMDDIRDRRNELTENISFQQEVSAIAFLNRLALTGGLAGDALRRYATVKIRVIAMAPEIAEPLDYESKFDRNPLLIEQLLEHGDDQARRFLDALRSEDADELTALPRRDIWGSWTG